MPRADYEQDVVSPAGALPAEPSVTRAGRLPFGLLPSALLAVSLGCAPGSLTQPDQLLHAAALPTGAAPTTPLALDLPLTADAKPLVSFTLATAIGLALLNSPLLAEARAGIDLGGARQLAVAAQLEPQL